MNEVTILQMGDNIIVPIQVELHDRAALQLQENILSHIHETGARGLIIDVSAVTIVDSFLGRLLGETSRMAGLLGAVTVMVGLKKEVVMTLIQLGLAIVDLHTALNLEDGIFLLESLKRAADGNSDELEEVMGDDDAEERHD